MQLCLIILFLFLLFTYSNIKEFLIFILSATKMQGYDMQIAATIFNEARGQSSAGRQAVAAVIYNRQKYKCPKCSSNHGFSNWRNKKAFHGYSNTKPNVPEAQKAIWAECEKFASGSVADNTKGATHFQKATWGQGYENLIKIGSHYFAREKTEQTRHQ